VILARLLLNAPTPSPGVEHEFPDPIRKGQFAVDIFDARGFAATHGRAAGAGAAAPPDIPHAMSPDVADGWVRRSAQVDVSILHDDDSLVSEPARVRGDDAAGVLKVRQHVP
jgi:hypothetical protein